mmetsp:Transcript_13607/g.24328  ORF Transcript_13607/g.24328 Transcript_13607/m.24328 type:complete len:271 (-) Transcript_13607:1324-2136(-)
MKQRSVRRKRSRSLLQGRFNLSIVDVVIEERLRKNKNGLRRSRQGWRKWLPREVHTWNQKKKLLTMQIGSSTGMTAPRLTIILIFKPRRHAGQIQGVQMGVMKQWAQQPTMTLITTTQMLMQTILGRVMSTGTMMSMETGLKGTTMSKEIGSARATAEVLIILSRHTLTTMVTVLMIVHKWGMKVIPRVESMQMQLGECTMMITTKHRTTTTTTPARPYGRHHQVLFRRTQVRRKLPVLSRSILLKSVNQAKTMKRSLCACEYHHLKAVG